MSFGEEFTYDVLKDELVIGEVYVRVYNEQPTFVLEVILLSSQALLVGKRVIRIEYFKSMEYIYSS